MSANDVIPQEEFPEWMRQAQRKVDWGAIIILGFCLLAGMSFITQAELPAYNDTEHYVYQISDYAEAFSEGIAYNRWSPYAISGYGAPIPHYYPSGTAYLGGLISYLFTNNALLATKILYMFSFVLAGSMIYHFIKLQRSALSGMIASLIYIFSPFVMITVAHIEGNLALSLGIGLLPSLLWAISRFLKRQQAFDFTLIALIVGITVFIIPSILLQGLVASSVLIMLEFRQGLKLKQILLCLCAILLGILLASFYWIPAFLQANEVEWYPALIEAPNSQLLWRDLFLPSQAIDSGFLKPLPTYNLGLGLLFVIPISLITMLLKKDKSLFYLSFLGLGVTILGIILLFAPQQTSWLALITLALAISASYHGYAVLYTKGIQSILITISMVIILVSSMPSWIIPKPDLTISTATADEQINYYQSGYGYAGLPVGLDLPSHLPPNTDLISPDIDESRFASRQAALISIDESAYIGRFTISTDTALELEYQRAYFPNWQTFDSTGNLSLTESNNNLLSLNIPVDTDTNATIRFGITTTTGFAWAISLGALFTCGYFWWYRWRITEGDYDTSILLSGRSLQIIIPILILFTILRVVAPSIPSNLLTQDAQYTMRNSLFVQTNFDNNFQLLAYDNPTETYQAGDIVRIRAFWQIDNEKESHYLVQLRLTDRNRQDNFYETGYSHAGYFPSNRWQAGSILPQDFIVRLPAGEQEYFIVFDVYECQTACSIDTMDNNQARGQIPVLRPIIMN